MRSPSGRGAGRRSALLLSSIATLMAVTAVPVLGSHHLPGEGAAEPAPAKVLVITPDDHVMLVGGSRVLIIEICNEDHSGCKPARKSKATVKPRNGLKLSGKKGAQIEVTGKKAGLYELTFKQGKATGSTTVKINEPPQRSTTAPAPELRAVSIPEHPVIVEGQPYVMSFYLCPVGVTLESALAEQAAAYGFVQAPADDERSDTGLPPLGDDARTPSGQVSVVGAGGVLRRFGCEPAAVTDVEPDEGIIQLYARGESLMLYKKAGANGFSARIVLEDGSSLYPSDFESYFGQLNELPGLEDVDFGAIDAELAARLDLDGDGQLTPGDLAAWGDKTLSLADGYDSFGVDLSAEEMAALEAELDVDGDGEYTANDAAVVEATLGEAILDSLLQTTAATGPTSG